MPMAWQTGNIIFPTLNTRFRIGSMNKMFTAVAVLQLVSAGKLKLDDPVIKYLPKLPEQGARIKGDDQLVTEPYRRHRRFPAANLYRFRRYHAARATTFRDSTRAGYLTTCVIALAITSKPTFAIRARIDLSLKKFRCS
jgi:hypothetical protein